MNDLIEDGSLLSPPRIKRIAIRDSFFSVAGSQEYLRKLAGLELSTEYFKI
jgi:transketolase